MKKKILIIEDEEEMSLLLKDRLEMEGYIVVVSKDGEDGLQKVLKEKPDLVLLDIMMPKMNGYQVCHTVKKDENTRMIPMIILTARASEQDKQWGKENGCDDYVTKPFAMTELLKKIERWVGKKLRLQKSQ